MKVNNLTSKSLNLLFCLVFTVCAILAPSQAHAVYDGVRANNYSSSYMCNTTDGNKYVDFNPTGFNVDYNFELTNTTCIAFAAASGAVMFAAGTASPTICQTAAYPANAAPAAAYTATCTANPPLPYPTPGLLIRLYAGGVVCGAMSANTAAANATCVSTTAAAVAAAGTPGGPAAATAAATACNAALVATADSTKCCAAVFSYVIAVAAVFAALAIIHGLANQAYATSRVCGYDWYGWEQLDSDGNASADGTWTKVKGPHQKCLRNLFLGESNSGVSGFCEQNSAIDISNKSYREYIYGGVEVEDNGEGSCENPTTWSSSRKNEILGYDSRDQRYYMTGAGNAPVYACYRFLAQSKTENGYTAEEDYTAMQKAYDCCTQRSQNAICIESKGGSRPTGGGDGSVSGATNYSNKFCEIGSKCTLNGVVYEAFASTRQVNYACAKTYSVCPYNHNVGGGTETKEETEDGDVVNYCQFLNHCSKLPILPYVRTSNLTGGYIDSSCRDMKGDSQNTYGYTAELLPISTRGFTAPMVQCFKETMQNIFLNKAGHTECLNPDEPPDQNENCTSGYVFQKGHSLEGDSFFVKLQNIFQNFLKLVLTISVIFYGVMILMAVPKAYIQRKTIFPYILKLALVCYFTFGNAWQAVFIEDLLGVSGTLAAIAFKPDDLTASTDKQDGCQFPRYNYADSDQSTKYTNPAYPPGKDYLEVWDVLDCKIARALGFGPEVSVPNLIFMILGGFFTAGYGLLFVVGAFMFAFFLIFATIRALQFFLVAMTAVIILIYASVFIIPMSLFSRTKNIFDAWWKQMLGFTLQPMILFAYLGVLIAIFDNIVIGSATFTPATVKIDGVSVVDTYGRIMPKTISCNSAAENDSIYCIFNVADIKTYNGFEALGIGLPILGSLNTTKLLTIIKAALLMFIFSQFMDKISEVASTLVGGAGIETSWGVKPSEMAQKAFGALKGVQDRGMRVASAVGRKGIESMSGMAQAAGNKGKRQAEVSDKAKDAVDSTESSKRPALKEEMVADSTAQEGALTDEVKKDKETADVTSGGGNNPPPPPPADNKQDNVSAAGGGGDNLPPPPPNADDTKSVTPPPPPNTDSDTKSSSVSGGGDEDKEKKDAKQDVDQSGEKKDGEQSDEKKDEPTEKKDEEQSGEKKDEPTEKKDEEQSGGSDNNSPPPPPPSADKAVESDTKQDTDQSADKKDEDQSGEKKDVQPTDQPVAQNEDIKSDDGGGDKKSDGGNNTSTSTAEQNNPPVAPNVPAPSKSSGGTPSYMKSTAAHDTRIAQTAEKFGVKTSLPSGMQQSGKGSASSSGGNSSVKTAVKSGDGNKSAPVKSSAPTKSHPPASGGSANKSSSVKSATPTKSSAPAKSQPSGGTPNYMKSTASSAAKQKPPVQRSGGPQKKK